MIVNNNRQLNTLRHMIYACYTQESCYHTVKDKWSEECKELGQDTITAIIIKDNFGGLIKRIYIKEYDYYHFYNIIDKKVVDFTRCQFPKTLNIAYTDGQTKSRAKLLDIVDLKHRYETMCEQIKHKQNELNNLLNELDRVNIKFSLYLNDDCKFFIVTQDYIDITQIENSNQLTAGEKQYLIENASSISYILINSTPQANKYIDQLTQILRPYKVLRLG